MPRHNLFSNSEMRDMLCVYAQEDFNGRRAHRRYLQTYPNRRQPDFKIFKRIYDRLGETGSFRPKRDILGRPKRITVEQEEEILVRVAEDPQISTRRLKTLTGVSQTGVLKVLHKERLHPYYFTPVQFSNFCRIRHNEDPTFLDRILFTDEATFTRRGIFNYRNKHVWDTENPHAVTARHFQHKFKVNIWCGIIDNYFLGPYELPPNLNGPFYLNFSIVSIDD
ncbi:hypothetical protein NQ315_012510 [Exocentrus adspersus]|uniref:DUF4817 domain-containing protein n=1 Tax=Exocentrus adspersus TaxID=1586481 RepID=A0AAV8V9E3_9CUCU|nr:hypothetical protein NQ315_012510 [Exocentrus adspersus]